MTRATMLCLLLLSLSALAESAGGLSWSAPKGWTAGEPRPMRAATYAVPATKGDAEGGECAVFYFGKGQGGSVDDNVTRWANQFEGGKPVTRKEKVNGFEVTRVELEGTFHSGGMTTTVVNKPGFKLLGAIVEGKEGAVFFKLTAPAKTAEAARKDFEAMLKAVKAG